MRKRVTSMVMGMVLVMGLSGVVGCDELTGQLIQSVLPQPVEYRSGSYEDDFDFWGGYSSEYHEESGVRYQWPGWIANIFDRDDDD